MSNTVKFGMDAKLYYVAGGVAQIGQGTPPAAWAELSNIKDNTLSVESGEADVTTRANQGWKATLPTLKDANIAFDMLWNTGDAGFTALQQAWLNKQPIGILCLDGDRTVTGNQGLKADMAVLKFDRDEKLADAITVKVTLKPTFSSTAPSWVTMPES